MKTWHVILGVLAVVSAFGCSPQPQPQAAEPVPERPQDSTLTAEDRTSIAQWVTGFQTAWKARDVDQVGTFFSERMTVSDGGNKERVLFGIKMGLIASTAVDIRDLQIHAVGHRVQATPIVVSDGADLMYRLTFLIEKEDADWKVVQLIIDRGDELPDAEEVDDGWPPFQSAY